MSRITQKSVEKVDTMSSFLVYRAVIIIVFLTSLLMNWLGLSIFAVLLFIVAVLGVISRLWGLFSLRRVEVQITTGKSTMSVGDTAVISYSVTNNKLLPVMWLELCQDMPDNNCLAPDSGFSRYEMPPEDTDSEMKVFILRRRIIFLMSFQNMSWDTVWSAGRRGLYFIDRLMLRSGDGFGLTQGSRTIQTGGRLLVVWPRIVPVKTEPFFRNAWQGPTGRSGYVEDPTVLRGLRDYMPGDSWKLIDWRVAARQDEIQIRKFETMLPGTVYFILDVESFLHISENNDELEEAISILASLILELDDLGIHCGLSLPRCLNLPTVDISPENTEAGGRDLLYALSALNADKSTGGFDEAAIESISQISGQTWLLTYSGEGLTCRDLADKMENVGFSVLCYDCSAPGILADHVMLDIRDLARRSHMGKS